MANRRLSCSFQDDNCRFLLVGYLLLFYQLVKAFVAHIKRTVFPSDKTISAACFFVVDDVLPRLFFFL